MPRKRAANGRFTAARTTKTTTEVTETLTLEELHWADGWDPGPITPRHDYLVQRAGQQDQALGLLTLWAQSTSPGEPVPGWLIRQAVNVLRAGPNASPLELTLGRSI